MIELGNKYSSIVTGIKSAKSIKNLEYIKQHQLEDLSKEAKNELTRLVAEREEALKKSGEAFKEQDLHSVHFWYGKDLVNKPALKYSGTTQPNGGTYNAKIVKNISTKN